MPRKSKSQPKVISSFDFKKIFIFVIVLVVAGVVIFWVGKKLFSGKFKSEKQIFTSLTPGASSPTPFPDLTTEPTGEESTPTPTPTSAEVKLDSYNIQVLNGGGKTGVAQEVGDLLEKEGFKVSSVGNAYRWDYQKTEIRGKENVSRSVLEKIDEVISPSYVTQIKANATNTGDFDILIVLGRETP